MCSHLQNAMGVVVFLCHSAEGQIYSPPEIRSIFHEKPEPALGGSKRSKNVLRHSNPSNLQNRSILSFLVPNFIRLDVWERSLGKNSLSNNCRESKHSQTSILDFAKLHFVNLLLGLSLEESKRIKSEVTRGTSRILVKHLNERNRGNRLENTAPEEDLGHGSLLNKSIVSSYGGKSFICLRERVNSSSHVNSNETGPCKHTNTSVLDLCLTEEVHGCKVRETKGVESSISYVSIKVCRVRKEGKCLRLLSSERSRSASCEGSHR